MIAVTGANGQLGRLVIQSLLAKTDAKNIVALVRNIDSAKDFESQGIQVRQADYNRAETLEAALAGIEKLLLISGSEIGQRVPQHQAVIDAAKTANVKLLAYTSILKADVSPLILASEHKATEELISTSGVPAVILRNGWYSENYTHGLAGTIAAGVVAGVTKDGVMYTASRQDYAEAAATVLTSTSDQSGKTYELAGDHGFTLSQYAAEITKQLGKDIGYQTLSAAEFTDMLNQVGLPNGLVEVLVDAGIQAEEGWLAEESGTLSALIGRPTTSISESIEQALAAEQ